MPNYETASSTKDYYALQLISEFPQIVSVAPRLALDSNGVPTDEGVIVVGVRHVSLCHDLSGQLFNQGINEIPSELPIVEPDGTLSANEMMPVKVEYVGDISFTTNSARVRPCPGGFSISRSTQFTAGTLGTVVRVNGTWGFILSCNHVIALDNGGTVGDRIRQPGTADGGVVMNDDIATLERWIPINFDGNTVNEVDSALARVLEPWEDFVTRNVYGIGIPAAIGDAKVNQEVRKSGRTTQLTTGIVLSDNATILTGGALFQNQLEFTSMWTFGDSGSLIFDRNSLTVLGLAMSMNSEGTRCYGNKIARVLELLNQATTIFNVDGTRTDFDEIKVELF